MKITKKHRCLAIREQQPDLFAEQYEKAMQAAKGPEVIRQYSDGAFIAIITWVEEERSPETVREEYNEQGIKYVCGSCPYCEQDGDGRRHRFPCKYAVYATVDVRQEACELFYKKVQQGEIIPEGF